MSRIKIQPKNVILALVIFSSIAFALWQMVYLAKNQSITTDEKVHIPAGFSYWQFKNFYLNPEHPPLAKVLVSLPVYLQHPKYPDTTQLFKVEKDFYYDSWAETRRWGQDFLFNSGNNLNQIVFSARFVNIILTIVLILFLIFWSFQIGGLKAAALSAVLSSFNPLFLAHGSLANTDLLITLDFSLLMYFWWRYLKEKNLRWFLVSAVVFGIGALSKFSFVVFIPVLFLTGVLAVVTGSPRRLLGVVEMAGRILIFVSVAWLMVMAFYGFDFTLAPIFTGLRQLHEAFNPAGIKAIEFFRQFLIPSWYFKGLFMVLAGAFFGRGISYVYIFGNSYLNGAWFYFPVSFIFKTPIGFLELLIASIVLIKKLWQRDYVLQIVLLGGAVIFLGVTMLSKVNLGQRHIMPLYPLLIVFVSQIASLVKTKTQMMILLLLVSSIILSTTFNYSNQIAYYNELIGGGKNGYRVLLDSNYDWGQSLPAIGRYLKEHNLVGTEHCSVPTKNVYLQYQWAQLSEHKFYGFSLPDLKSFNPKEDATIIIDPASLYTKKEYAWVKDLPVVGRIANTIFVMEYTP